MSVTASRLREWANSSNTQAPPAWVGDRGAGWWPPTTGPGPSDRRTTAEWGSTAYGFDSLGRVRHGADPHDLVAHVFDNRLNALGLAEWLERGGKGSFRVVALLKGVGGGD